MSLSLTAATTKMSLSLMETMVELRARGLWFDYIG